MGRLAGCAPDELSCAERGAATPTDRDGSASHGGGRAYSHREVAETINDVFGNSGNLVFDQSRREDTSVFYMDCSRAKSDLGWHPVWTLRDGLEDMRREYEGQSQCPRLP